MIDYEAMVVAKNASSLDEEVTRVWVFASTGSA